MKKNTTQRTLENNAARGDIKAKYKLYEMYRDGLRVEKNNEISQKYYREVLSDFSKNRLTITRLKLVDFRVFKDLEVDFPRGFGRNASRITVIVGNNGAGKTSILEAISSGLKFITRRIANLTANAHNLLDELDVNVSSQTGVADIFLNFEVLKGVDFGLSLSKSSPLSKSKKKSGLSDVGQLSEIYRYYHLDNNDGSLPLMAFYSVKRSNDVVKKDIGFSIDGPGSSSYSILDGYKDAFDGYANFGLLFAWLKKLEDIANEQEGVKAELVSNITRLRSELDSDFAKSMAADSDKSEILKKHYESFVAERTRELAYNVERLNSIEGGYERKLINYVVSAISTFMDGFDNLRIQRKPNLDMLIDKNGTTLSVLQLSQGEKSLMALIADIARRLVLLNPSLKNPLLGYGIVLIDEIDLHLHPSWQQVVIPKLLNTFKNVQFIITTHSPQVLTTVDSESVRILEDGRITWAPVGCQGAESSRLLDRVFNVSPRPLNNDIVKTLNRYKNLVYSGEHNSHEACQLRKELDANFGDEDPDLKEIDLFIENSKWEEEIEKDLQDPGTE